ncbi:MAG: phage/plasmid primase, P4 family [Candidatus Acidiferrales bacterium]|jgi:putative DNA primase/helicase
MSRTHKQHLPHRTDSGNAELFAALYGEKVLFDHKQGRWLIWNETRSRWLEDKQGKVRILAKRAARQRAKLALNIGDEDKRKEEIQWAFKSEGRYQIDAALELAKSEAPISDDGEGWDSDHWQFGVANGIVDLRTGTLRPATQQDRITKFSPVAFDPNAKCPRFELYLEETFGADADLKSYVQKAVGYSLTGCTREQCLFACYGEGSNGKTTLLEIILYVQGDYGLDLPFSVLEAKLGGSTPGEGVNLPGARFAKAVETREGKKLDEARIKSWTGGDTITVRPLYRNSFSFRPTHKLWLAFNHKPIIGDDSNAMWRRIRLIPFVHTFDPRHADKGMLEKLKAEAPGILNWAIVGCLAWQKDGLKTPKAVEQATSEYEAESDPLAPFFEDCCELDMAFQVSKTELRIAYQDWCRANKEKPVSRKAFPEKMKKKGFREGSSGSARFWTGLRCRKQAEARRIEPNDPALVSEILNVNPEADAYTSH